MTPGASLLDPPGGCCGILETLPVILPDSLELASRRILQSGQRCDFHHASILSVGILFTLPDSLGDASRSNWIASVSDRRIALITLVQGSFCLGLYAPLQYHMRQFAY